MRTRDEVLREFGAAELTRLLPPVVAESVERMADRIRELEAQLVSPPYTLVSEPVAWAVMLASDKPMTFAASREGLSFWENAGHRVIPLYAASQSAGAVTEAKND